jgi:hypothetical protein
MLQGVTLAHKGLSPSGLSSKSYYSKNLIIFTIQGAHTWYSLLPDSRLQKSVLLINLGCNLINLSFESRQQTIPSPLAAQILVLYGQDKNAPKSAPAMHKMVS